MKRSSKGKIPATLPFLPAAYLLAQALIDEGRSPIRIVWTWVQHFSTGRMLQREHHNGDTKSLGGKLEPPTVGSQLLAYIIVAVLGYFATDYLIPRIKVCTKVLLYCLLHVGGSTIRLLPTLASETRCLLLQTSKSKGVVRLIQPTAPSPILFWSQTYTLRKGISGKDIGKRGTSSEDKDMYVTWLSILCFIMLLYSFFHQLKSYLVSCP